MSRAKALAKEDYKWELKHMMDFSIQEELKMLLKEPKKKKQQQLIKTIQYNSELFMAFPI